LKETPIFHVCIKRKEQQTKYMAQSINLDEDYVSAEECELIKTKQAILEKLRVRFGDLANDKRWLSAQKPHPATSLGNRTGPARF
jgi:hypothetical protein